MLTYRPQVILFFLFVILLVPKASAKDSDLMAVLDEVESYLNTISASHMHDEISQEEKSPLRIQVDFFMENYDDCTFLAKRNILREIFNQYTSGSLVGAEDLREFLEIEYNYLLANPADTKKYKAESTLLRKRLKWLNNALES